jgi:hypothetical protein
MGGITFVKAEGEKGGFRVDLLGLEGPHEGIEIDGGLVMVGVDESQHVGREFLLGESLRGGAGT